MWKWSKEIIDKIKRTGSATDNDLLNIEIGTRMLTAIYTIQGLKSENGHIHVDVNEDAIDKTLCEWSEGVYERVKDLECLSEEELKFVRLSLYALDIHDSLLDEHLQLEKTDIFELQCSPYIKRD